MKTLEEHVQLEFPFTKKGYMQERAILQDLFLRDKYYLFLQDCFGRPHSIKPFQQFELEEGQYLMKQFSRDNPYDATYLTRLIT